MFITHPTTHHTVPKSRIVVTTHTFIIYRVLIIYTSKL